MDAPARPGSVPGHLGESHLSLWFGRGHSPCILHAMMGHARGVVLLAGAMHDAQIGELTATEVKKAITGNGHAGKRQVQEAVAAQCNLPEPPSPPDVADAIAIALCAGRRVAAERLAARMPT